MWLFFLGILCALLAPLAGSAQVYNAPSVLYRIMASSKLHYTFVALGPQHVLEHSAVVDTVPAGLYLATKGRKHLANERDTIARDTVLSRLWMQAEQARQQGNTTSARQAYDTLLQHCPTNALIRTAQAEVELYEGDTAQAKKCLLRAVQHNPFAYAAHRHLAELYAKAGAMEKAVEHITLAHLYNRTDTAILGVLSAIYARNGTPYDTWTFHPQYALLHKPNDKREIATDTTEGAWMMYALCRALWRFEFSYTTPLTSTMHASLPVVEKYEALYVLADAARYMYPNSSCPTTSIRKLVEAIDNGDIDSFYWYEQTLVRSPQTILLLRGEERHALLAYIQKYHTIKTDSTMRE